MGPRIDFRNLTYLTSLKTAQGCFFILLAEKLTCLFQKWKYYIDYEHMTVNTEGFDSKCMWYLYGDCILTKYSFYRSALTLIITISEHISLECHPSIYRHPLYNAKGEFPQRWRYKGGGLYIYMDHSEMSTHPEVRIYTDYYVNLIHG